jgi:prevent-host-death family protein
MCYIVHMKKITIRELHIDTGKLVRSASREQKLIVTDRGTPIATITPYTRDDAGKSFSQRKLIPGFSALTRQSGDSTSIISEDRDR